jgi:hypothetical protein
VSDPEQESDDDTSIADRPWRRILLEAWRNFTSTCDEAAVFIFIFVE